MPVQAIGAATDLPRSAPVVIIGGGIVGVTTAYFLGLYGIGSLILEAAEAPGTRTTAMSAHCIRAQFGEPDNIAMMSESLAFYEAFAEQPGLGGSPNPIRLCQQGYLFASTDPGDQPHFAARVAQQAEAGLDDVELLDGDEVRRRFPWLDREIATATFRHRDGWIESDRAVHALAAASGASIALGVSATGIDVVSGKVRGVTTGHGRIDTDTVVIAAGPWSRKLSPEPLPVVLWRRHRVIVRPDAIIPQDGPVTIDANTGAHWRPHQGGALVAWARAETDRDAVWPVPADRSFVDDVLRGPDGIGRLAPFWRDLGPRLTDQDLLLTAGLYTMTPDHRPVIGAAHMTDGLYFNTGYSGHGIMGAPAGSRLLAGVIAGTVSANPFSLERFSNGAAPPDVERVVI